MGNKKGNKYNRTVPKVGQCDGTRGHPDPRISRRIWSRSCGPAACVTHLGVISRVVRIVVHSASQPASQPSRHGAENPRGTRAETALTFLSRTRVHVKYYDAVTFATIIADSRPVPPSVFLAFTTQYFCGHRPI